MMNELKEHKTNLSLNALKGMQSVRATFTLPRNIINLLSVVANQLGVKQKSIFDHLVENKHVLDQVADEAQNYQPAEKKRKQKTFVLSRNSLTTLDAFAKKYKLPRDILVEFSIKQLRPVIDAEKQKHENRKTLLKEMENFLELGHEMMEKARNLVGEDDMVCQKLQDVLSLHDRNVEELKTTIERGKCMEKFQ